MLAKNPLGERFDVPDFDVERTRFMSAAEFIRAFNENEKAPKKPEIPGQMEAFGRSWRATKAADTAYFEICLWTKVRLFAREHNLLENVETIDAMCDWQNYPWSERFNAFSHVSELCSLTDHSKCLVSKGYRPVSKSLEDAIERAGKAFKEEFDAAIAYTPIDIAYTGDSTVAEANTLAAKRQFNSRLNRVALTTRRL